MTAEAFTTAARAEAQRAYQDTGMPRYDLAIHMAAWARDHLAAQEPTDAEIQEVAERMKEQAPQGSHEWPEWVWTRFARVALTAAQEARR